MLRRSFHQQGIRKNFLKTILCRCLCVPSPKRVLTNKELNIGQPTPLTHSHIFGSQAECTPGITHDEFRMRRENLIKTLSKMNTPHDRHVVVLSANDLQMMSNDIPYFFHQDTDFLYFTGLQEPGAIAVLETSNSCKSMNFILFVNRKDPRRELWDGAVAGVQAVVEYFNADEAYPIESFDSIFRERYGGSNSCVWVKRGKEVNERTKTVLELLETEHLNQCDIQDVCIYTQRMRVLKSPAEIALLRDSSNIAANAFKKVMRHTTPGLSEGQLHALLEYHCKNLGAQHLSFPPVVAGGSRANTLHYINNDRLLHKHDMVLMDGGCVFHGYASDVTRTWPASGHFSKPQATLYEIVLNILKQCTLECEKGNVSINHLHSLMLTLLGQELQKLGFIKPNITREFDLQRAATRFCPHNIGHFLGMDTHDCPLINKSLTLQNGMAFTVEPGIYIPDDALDVPKEYRGIGIRIEDDVVITNDGPFVLTNELPKEISDIETLMKAK